MDSRIMTPTTALFLSLIDFKSLDTPRSHPLITSGDCSDVFAQSFLKHNNRCEPTAGLTRISQDLPTQEQTPPSSTDPSEPPSFLALEKYTDNRCDYATYSKDFSPPESENSLQSSQPSNTPGLGETVDLNSAYFDDVLPQEAAVGEYTAFRDAIERRFKEARESKRQISDQINEPQSPHPSPQTIASPPPLLSKAAIHALPSPAPAPKSRGRRICKRQVASAAEAKTKRDTFLERNRRAAIRCRVKKKDWVGQLEVDVETGRERNLELKAEYRGLVEEVRRLKGVVARCGVEGKRRVGSVDVDEGEAGGEGLMGG